MLSKNTVKQKNQFFREACIEIAAIITNGYVFKNFKLYLSTFDKDMLFY